MSNLLILTILGAAVAAGCFAYLRGKVTGRREGYRDCLSDMASADAAVSPSAAGGPGGVPR